MKHISSAHNESLKHLAKLLTSAKARRSSRQIVLEGVHLAQSCWQANIVPEQIWLPAHKLHQPEIQSLITQMPSEKIYLVDSGALEKISQLADGENVMTLIKMPSEHIAPHDKACVVLERVQDPGNVGTILRSAAASGIQHIVLDKDCADVFSPKVLRSAMGAHFMLNIHTHTPLHEWQANYRLPLFATALNERAENLYALDLSQPCAWLFGNEGNGVSDEMLQLADKVVKIPMIGNTESLNVAMAVTVCLFEQMRQTHAV